MAKGNALAKFEPRLVEFHRVLDNGLVNVYRYLVSFEYFFDYPLLVKKNVMDYRTVTLAFVKELYPDGSDANFTGMAVLHPGEDFSRPVGRMEALKKVMVHQFRFSEDEQSAFLEAYQDAENTI
jgi:hypothetical protein